MRRAAHFAAYERGIGLIEIMIGSVVALITSLVIFQVLSVSEGYRRTTVGGAHASDNGSFGLFFLERQLTGAGAGLARTPSVWGCLVRLTRANVLVLPAATAFPAPFDSLPQTIRAAPLLVRDGGGAAPDTILTFASVSSAAGANSHADGLPNAKEVAVTTTAGITPGDLLMAFDPARAGSDCTVVQIANAFVAPIAPATVSSISNPLRYAGANFSPATGLTGYSSNTLFVNLGGAPTLAAFGVGTDTASGRPNVLLRYDLIAGGAPVAIADNIVNLQVLYGIAATPTAEPASQWVSATGLWAIEALTDGSAAAADRLARLRGLRIALVARTGIEEREAASPATWELFRDRPSETVKGTLDASAMRYRYKVFETTVPLRNMLLAND